MACLGSQPTLPLLDQRCLQEGRGQGAGSRIHMIAGQPVRVLNDALFTDVHKDLLSAHGTHAVGKVLGRHA